MKKIGYLLLVLCLIFSLSACDSNEATTNNDTGSSATHNQTDITDTNSTEQSTDAPSSTTDTNDVSDSTDVPGSNTGTPTTTKPETSDPTNTTTPETSDPTNTTTPETSDPTNTTTPETSDPTNTTTPETSDPTNTTTPNTTTHTHSYSAATCTTPAKCSCGATNGSALGHKWQDATCKAPKTCSTCKTTQGDKSKHTYNADGICSVCNSNDPNFKYLPLTSMNGVWKSIHKEGKSLIELTHHFYASPPADLLPYGAIEWYYTPKEEIVLDDDESLSAFESVVLDGISYYKHGGGFVMEGIFEESGNKIIVTDFYSKNKQMVLQRISTNTMKVMSFDSEIEYTKIPIGTILTFCENT